MRDVSGPFHENIRIKSSQTKRWVEIFLTLFIWEKLIKSLLICVKKSTASAPNSNKFADPPRRLLTTRILKGFLIKNLTFFKDFFKKIDLTRNNLNSSIFGLCQYLN